MDEPRVHHRRAPLMRLWMTAPGWRPLAVLGVLCLVLAACAGPVGTHRADPKVVLRDLARSATTTGEPSWPTRNVLLEQGLLDEFAERPEEALAGLHKTMVASGGDPDLLFALAELSFLHGQTAAKPELPHGAAIYAYAFLFPEGSGSPPGRFDPRLRLAADLYNWALMAALRLGGRVGGRPARRHVRAALRRDRGGFRSRRPCAPGTGELYQLHPDRRAGDARPGDAVPLAGPRGAPGRLHPAHRRFEARPGHGGAEAARCR